MSIEKLRNLNLKIQPAAKVNCFERRIYQKTRNIKRSSYLKFRIVKRREIQLIKEDEML